MDQELIFQPMLATIALTAVVWFYMYARRIPAMKKARKPTQTYTTPDTVIEHLPEQVNYSANNLKNLFELPVLFYALCVYFYVTNSVDNPLVYAGWLFFAFRAVHSAVHCTSNIVIARFVTYCGAAVALWYMLARALLNAF